MKRVTVAATLATSALILSTAPAHAEDAVNCQQILLVGARGSGQTLAEAREHNRLKERLKAGVSGLAFDDIQLGDVNAAKGVLDDGGYRALGSSDWFGAGYLAINIKRSWPSITNPTGISLRIDADKASMGPYYDSQKVGTQELTDWLGARAQRCPDERYVLDGYSQGAHAIGEGLSGLPEDVKQRTDFVALFADPVAQSPGPWHRGSARAPWGSLNLVGGADRYPYVPTSLRGSTGLWCDSHDGVCDPKGAALFAVDDLLKEISKLSVIALWTGAPEWNKVKDALAKAHSEYAQPNAEVDLASNEILERLRAKHPSWDSNLQTALLPLKIGNSPKVDISFVIDTTGSMWDDIDAAKDSANRIADTVLAFPDARVQLVEYRDYGDSFQAREVVPFTANANSFKNGLSGLSADEGGDWPESVYSGLMTAFQGDWRPGARKLAVLLGDAPAHNPEEGTGYTRDQVLQRAFELDPVVIDAIVIGGDQEAAASFQELADGSGGSVFAADGAGDVADSLVQSLDDFRASPVAVLNGPYPTDPNEVVTVPLNQEVTFSAVGSFDPDSAIDRYDWDFNQDGVTDASGPDPVVARTFTATYEGLVSVKVVSLDGGQATATLPLKAGVGESVHMVPGAPTSVAATGDAAAARATITWSSPQADGGEPITGYIVTDAAGIPLVLAGSEVAAAEVPWDPTGGAQELRVSALNALGAGEYSATTVPVVPEVSGRTPTSITIKASAKRTKLRRPVTFTARLTGAPSGTIAFSDRGHRLGKATVSSGVAVLRTKRLFGGKQVVKATFAGDTTYSASSGTVKVSVRDKGKPKVSLRLPKRTTPSTAPATAWSAKDRGGVRQVTVKAKVGKSGWKRVARRAHAKGREVLPAVTRGTKVCFRVRAVDWAGNKRTVSRCARAK